MAADTVHQRPHGDPRSACGGSSATGSDRHQVVVGVDGSAHARLALRWASRVALLLDDEVTTVHGAGLLGRRDGHLVPARPDLDDLRHVLEDEWCGVLDRAHLPRRVEVLERPAVDAVLAAVDERPTDLVVVGTRGLAIPRAQAPGSTALQVLRRATVPVLVVPDGLDDRSVEIRRLVIGVDGSPAAEAAVRWAAGVASLTGARCEVVAVADDDPDRLRAVADAACGPLRDHGVRHEVTVRRGQPAETLLAVARERHADLVVVGSSGQGSRGNPLLGSVSRRVAHDAGRPVVVVPDRRRRDPDRAPEGHGVTTGLTGGRTR